MFLVDDTREPASALKREGFDYRIQIHDPTTRIERVFSDIDPNARGSNWIDTDRENDITTEELEQRLLEGDLGS